MASFPSGVVILTAFGDDHQPRGLTVSAFCAVSVDPPLALVCIDKTSNTLPAVQHTGGFTANILAAGREHLARRMATKRALSLAALAFVAVLGLLVAANVGGVRSLLWSRGQIQSLAVLPLANLSGDPAQDYFADGMTEAMITELAQISALRVISRTSVMQYRGGKKSLPEIAGELHVDSVIEGSVLRSGEKVRITAQWIQAVPERHLWAKSYDGDLRDVMAIQSQVARSVAGEIRVKQAEEIVGSSL